MIVEGDLANTVDQSNKIREMQDKIANLRAQVNIWDHCWWLNIYFKYLITHENSVSNWWNDGNQNKEWVLKLCLRERVSAKKMWRNVFSDTFFCKMAKCMYINSIIKIFIYSPWFFRNNSISGATSLKALRKESLM